MPKKLKAYRKYKKRGKKLATVSTVRKMIRSNQEVKFNLTEIDYDTITELSTNCIDLCSIAQGDTDKERVGDEINLRDLRVKVVIDPPQLHSTDKGYNDNYNVRVIIFQWFATSIPGPGNILLNYNQWSNPPNSNALSFYTIDYSSQYKVVYDKTVLICQNIDSNQNTTPLSGFNNRHYLSINIPEYKIPRKKLKFINGTTSGSNKFYMLLISDGYSLSSRYPLYHAVSKIDYTDS